MVFIMGGTPHGNLDPAALRERAAQASQPLSELQNEVPHGSGFKVSGSSDLVGLEFSGTERVHGIILLMDKILHYPL